MSEFFFFLALLSFGLYLVWEFRQSDNEIVQLTTDLENARLENDIVWMLLAEHEDKPVNWGLLYGDEDELCTGDEPFDQEVQ